MCCWTLCGVSDVQAGWQAGLMRGGSERGLELTLTLFCSHSIPQGARYRRNYSSRHNRASECTYLCLEARALAHPPLTLQERVKGYFDKINIAQGRAERSSDDASRSKVDTVAAGRFVRAALASGAATKPAGTHTRFEAEEESDSSDSDSSEEDKALPSTATAKAEKSAAPKVEAVKATPYAGE